MSRRSWRLLLGGCFLIGLGVRIAAVLGRPHLHAGGDAAEYWLLSNYVAEGKGWVEPYILHGTGASVQTAKLPPLYTLLLVPCSLVGFKSYFAHRIWSALLSSLGVPVMAWLGREVAGPTVAVVAALGMALYPTIWMPAYVGLSETIAPVMAAFVLLAAYRMWYSPSAGRAAWLGLSIGLAALARDEMAVLAVLILLPLAFGRRGEHRSWQERLRLLGSGVGVAVLAVSPWVAFNMARFSHPVLISDRFGVALAAANCDPTWHGPFAGYWLQSCAIAAVGDAKGDEYEVDAQARGIGERYIENHVSGLPLLEVERLGRTFGFWRVSQEMQFDDFFGGWPAPWTWVGLWSFYALVLLAPFGARRLRRSGVPLFPLVAVLAEVVLVVLITYGQTRFRTTFEPVLLLLGATGACAMVDHARHRVTGARASD